MEYKKPELNPEWNVTSREQSIVDQYTKIRSCVVEDEPDAHTAWLVINNQYFRVTPMYSDTAEQASWCCWMLAKALSTIIKG